MACAGCGFQALPEFSFCPKCGSRLPTPCPSCGFACAADFAFCPRCAARLSGGPEPRPTASPAPAASAPPRDPVSGNQQGEERTDADRRPVTVVFADLSGFTALGERLDPEEIRALQTALFAEMSGAVEQYGGLVEKFVGDAVMAVFGAPVAHEDDPERALRAALAMQQRIGNLNQQWERRCGRPLALHIGVNTGAVVAGTLGSTSGAAYAVTGDTVNTAARLQSAAPSGQVLVSAATYRLTQHTFDFESADPLTVKGKSEPVAVYRVLRALRRPGSARGLESLGLTAPLIGREDELRQMLTAFERMQEGRAQVVSLIGEAGAGKSRLLQELFVRLATGERLLNTTVRRAQCASLGEPTYGVWAAFLREAYGVAPEDNRDMARRKLASGLQSLGMEAEERELLAPLLSHALGLDPGEEALGPIEPEQLKRQMFLVARTLFERRLQQGPLMLVVEDLHWADAASVDLLRSMVDRLADRPILLLLTYRPTFDARALVTARATHTAIRLAPLSAADAEAFLEALFGLPADAFPSAVRDLLVGRSGGNPFFLEELVRGLVATGVFARHEGGWRCRAQEATADVPPTIQALLLSRVDRLPPAARRLVQEASVLGPVFDRRLLRMVASDRADCEPALDQLLEAELLGEVSQTSESSAAAPSERQYRFTPALVQEAVYQNLLLSRRTELHARAGRALETLCGGTPRRLEDLAMLGHHWSLSAERARGARYLLAAGDWARALYANEDALRHYRRALDTLRECDACADEMMRVEERLGDVLALIGQREAALAHYEAVRAAAAPAGSRAVEARVHRKVGRLHWDAGDRERGLGCYRTGLGLLEGQAEEIEVAHLYQEMGRMAFRAGDSPGAVEWAERALAHAQRLQQHLAGRAAPGDAEASKEASAAIAHAYNTLGAALARMGKTEEAVEYIERSVAVARAEGLLEVACRGYANLGALYGRLDPGRAVETCLAGLETAKKIGDLGFQSRLYTNLAVAYCTLTDRCDEQGIGAARTAIDVDRRLGQIDHLAVPLIVLGQIYQCHGDPTQAFNHFREALAIAEEAGDPQLLFPCYDGLATLYLETGDDAQAERYMLEAQQVCERAGLDPDSLVVLPFLD